MTAPLPRDLWNQRHAERGEAPPRACEGLIEFERDVPQCGCALDIACGAGGNAIWLARRGLAVEAIDVSDVAIERLQQSAAGLRVTTNRVNLHHFPWGERRADVIVVSRFLDRDLCPSIASSLAPGGVLLYQTFVGEYRGLGPRRAQYRLMPGELPRLFSQLDAVEYLEDPVSSPLSGYATLLARAPLA